MAWPSFKDIQGDIRNWGVGLVMTTLGAGVILVLAPIGAGIVKSYKAEPMPWTALILVAGGGLALAAFALIKLHRMQAAQVQTSESIQQPAKLVGADLVFLPPSSPHRYVWVPLTRLAIDQGRTLSSHPSFPVFTLENLSQEVVTEIHFNWSVISGTTAKKVFLASEYFRMYDATADEENLFWLHINRVGTAMSVSDNDESNIPYCRAGDVVNVLMPKTIANSIALRIVAGTQRPPKTNIPRGTLSVSGPTLHLDMTYRHLGVKYSRRFQIESIVTSLSNSVYSDYVGGNVPMDCSRPENFRGWATFKLIPQD